jgi:hypothetical protein
VIERFLDHVGDPQQEAVYRAQSDVVLATPGGDLADLAAAKEYVGSLAKVYCVELKGCFRASFYDGPGPGLVVNWAGRDSDYSGAEYELPNGGTAVILYNPALRWSGFDLDNNAILLAGPWGGPLSHRLLLIHELAHVINPIEKASHGPSYARTFLELTEQALPEAEPLLRRAFRNRGVAVEAPAGS